MNIEELKVSQKQLEIDIHRSVSEIYDQFKADTGVSPDSVYIEVCKIDRIGHKPEKIIGRVSVRIEL